MLIQLSEMHGARRVKVVISSFAVLNDILQYFAANLTPDCNSSRTT